MTKSPLLVRDEEETKEKKEDTTRKKDISEGRKMSP